MSDKPYQDRNKLVWRDVIKSMRNRGSRALEEVAGGYINIEEDERKKIESEDNKNRTQYLDNQQFIDFQVDVI